MQALGYNTWLYKLIAFIVSGLFAGVGGLLYVYYNGLIAPANIGMDASGLIMIMIIIGGGGTLWGAIFGSAIIFLVQYYVSIFIPERWPIVLGVCFIAAVFLARAGVFPRLNEAWKRLIKT
jgi:branched-chain amino acid transport system permease protein